MILEGRWLLSASWVKTLYAFMSSVEPHNDGNYTCSSKEIAAKKTAVVRILGKTYLLMLICAVEVIDGIKYMFFSIKH